MPAKTRPRLLLTGATGFIGFQILQDLLQLPHRPYDLRLVVRSEEKAEGIKNNAVIQKLNIPEDALEFVVLPDLQKEGVYSEAIKDCTYVIHVASPIPRRHSSNSTAELKQFFIEPAVAGTLELVKAAHRDPGQTVQRIVITSSLASLVTVEQMAGTQPIEEIITERSRTSTSDLQEMGESEAYIASKIAALNATEQWLDENKSKLSFSVVHIHPSVVAGQNNLASTAAEACQGTNWFIMAPLLGQLHLMQPLPPIPSGLAHVQDVAALHIAALDQEKLAVPNGGYLSLLVSSFFRLETIFQVANKLFPNATSSSKDDPSLLLADGDTFVSNIFHTDASETQKLVGMKFIEPVEVVRSILAQYIELASREQN